MNPLPLLGVETLYEVSDEVGDILAAIREGRNGKPHDGKPEIEMISTIIMGIYFGYVAYRSNSCWPAVLIHIYINITARVFVNWL